MQKFILVCCLALFAIQANAGSNSDNGAPHRGPHMTDDQRECMDSKLGKPGSGTRPTHEAFAAAAEACGLEAPPKRPSDQHSMDDENSAPPDDAE